jgi:hypothetical protein
MVLILTALLSGPAAMEAGELRNPVDDRPPGGFVVRGVAYDHAGGGRFVPAAAGGAVARSCREVFLDFVLE